MTIQDAHEASLIQISEHTPLPSEITTVAVEERDHTIKDFLSRYRLISSLTVPAGGANGDVLVRLALMNALLALQPIREKIKGFTYLRSNIAVRLLFTVPPTCSGGIRVIQAPDIDPTYLVNRTSTPLAQSQFPNQVFSLASLPSVELDVPFISQFSHRCLMANYPNPQNLIIARTSPSSAPVSISVYARFRTEDPDFSLTQPTAALPFFNTFSLTEEEEEVIRKMRETTTSHVLYEKKRGKTEAQATSGGLSGISHAIGASAKLLSNVPVVGGLASVVSPIADLASGIFSAFGFSKPQTEEPTKLVKLQVAPHHITCDGVSNAHTLGVQTMNKITEFPGIYGSSTDDMSFDKIVRHPNYIGSLTLTTAQTRGTVVGSYQITSMLGSVGMYPAPPNIGLFTLTHQTWINNFFKYWLAQVVFDFNIFTTSLHSIKLRFACVPGHFTSSVTNLSFDDTNSIVVDFGSNTTHQVVFPEVTNRQFLTNWLAPLKNASEGLPSMNFDNCMGTLFVLVEVPLKLTSDIVSPTVYGNVHLSYRNPRYMQMLDLNMNPVNETTREETESQVLSVYGENNNHATSEIVTTGSTSGNNEDSDKKNLDVLATCAGEAVVSLRQLCKQFTSYRFLPEMDNNSLVVYNPFANSYTNNTDSYKYTDQLDSIMAGFCFMRGSMVVRVLTNNPANDFLTTCRSGEVNNSSAKVEHLAVTTNQDLANYNRFRSVIVRKNNEGVLETHVPYYQPFHMVRNVPASEYALRPANTSNQNVLLIHNPTYKTAVSRQGGDDFSLGYLISLPRFTFRRGLAFSFPPVLN